MQTSADTTGQQAVAAPQPGVTDTVSRSGEEDLPGRRVAARATTQLAIEKGCVTALGYVTSIILAWGLGPAAFGLYGVLISFLNWSEQTAQFGIPTAATRLVAQSRDEHRHVEATTLGVGLAFLLVGFVAILIAAPGLASLFQMPGSANLFRLAALDIPFWGILVLYRGIAMGRHAFGLVAIAGVLYSSVRLAGVIALAATGISLPGALWVYLAGAPIGALFLASRLRVRLRYPSRETAAQLVRISIPLGLGGLALSLLHNLDVWSLKAFAPEGAERTIGLYYASRLIAKTPEVALAPVGAVLFPLISRALAAGNTGVARSYTEGAIRFLWVGFLPIVLFVAVEAEGIINLLFSSSYAGGGEYLRLLIFAYLLLAFVVIAVSILAARGDFYLTVWMGFALTGLLGVLAAVLIPDRGAAGAAIALLATASVGAGVFAVLITRRIGALIRLRTLLAAGLGAAAVAFAASWIQATGMLLVLEGAVLLGLYALGLTVMGELKRKDYEVLFLWRR